jgi:hypothetical protein
MNDLDNQSLDVTSSSLEGRHEFVVERTMVALAPETFDAWTLYFDTWFASPGELSMKAVRVHLIGGRDGPSTLAQWLLRRRVSPTSP